MTHNFEELWKKMSPERRAEVDAAVEKTIDEMCRNPVLIEHDILDWLEQDGQDCGERLNAALRFAMNNGF